VAEAHDGDPVRAARLLGAAEVLLESAGVPRYAMVVDQDLHPRVADTTRARLGDRAWEEAFVFDGEDPAPA